MVSVGRKLRAEYREAILSWVGARDRWLCYFCREPVEPEDAELHHRKPLEEGGPNRLWNYTVTHPECHRVTGPVRPSRKGAISAFYRRMRHRDRAESLKMLRPPQA